MADVTPDDLTWQITLLRTDPMKYLELAEKFIRANPTDAHGYFARYQARERLAQHELALDDINRVIELQPKGSNFEMRGWVLRELGQYHRAIEDLDRAEALDRKEWEGGFGLLVRADCYAKLGNLSAALADCARLPEDHWTPGLNDWPAGNKREVANELRRRAMVARRS